VTAGRLPSHRNLGGWMLDDMYMDVKKRVTDFIVSWAKHGIVTLALDGWENVNKSHVVNFLCISGGAAIFLDSVDTGSESQTAERQSSVTNTALALSKSILK
jgi:Protein of unknown function (DUF 659)